MKRKPLRKFSQKVQALLAEHGMSQADLAAALEVDRSWITRILKMTSSPSDRNVEAIARIFNVTFDYLVDEDIDAPAIPEPAKAKPGPKRRVDPPYPPDGGDEGHDRGVPRRDEPRHPAAASAPGGKDKYEMTLQTLIELHGAEEIVRKLLGDPAAIGRPYRYDTDEDGARSRKSS